MNDFLYSSNELLEMALKIEEDGEKFYDHLSKTFDDLKKKEFFSYLASQEKQHAKDFKRLLQGLTEEIEPTFWEEASKYVKSLVEDKIFPNVGEMIEKSKKMTLDDILNFSIGIEKETVIFYEELYDLVREKRSKEVLSRIIREEVGHVRNLFALKSQQN